MIGRPTKILNVFFCSESNGIEPVRKWLKSLTKETMKKNKHIGSRFDDFLEEEGILEECKEEAAKRILVWQLEQEIQKQRLTEY